MMQNRVGMPIRFGGIQVNQIKSLGPSVAQIEMDVTGQDARNFERFTQLGSDKIILRTNPGGGPLPVESTPKGEPLIGLVRGAAQSKPTTASTQKAVTSIPPDLKKMASRKLAFYRAGTWEGGYTLEHFEKLRQLIYALPYDDAKSIAVGLPSREEMFDILFLDLVSKYALRRQLLPGSKVVDPFCALSKMDSNNGISQIEILNPSSETLHLNFKVSDATVAQYPDLFRPDFNGTMIQDAHLRFKSVGPSKIKIEYTGSTVSGWLPPTSPNQYLQLWHLVKTLPDEKINHLYSKEGLINLLFYDLLSRYGQSGW
ncbi:MAG: hypothetical protein K2X66_14540 [Cyanobacteria bacterium]|nr:hypothetical protein [Cyanobacteriota bacterium]